jgi:hypothetical protein
LNLLDPTTQSGTWMDALISKSLHVMYA